MSVEDLEIRRCRPHDVPAVLELWNKARSRDASTPDTVDTVTQLLREAPGALWVADLADNIVGVVIAGWDGWRGNFCRLAVHPAHRRQGIALALVRAGEAELRKRGAQRISALAARDDQAAGELWRAAGYDLDAEIERFVRNL